MPVRKLWLLAFFTVLVTVADCSNARAQHSGMGGGGRGGKGHRSQSPDAKNPIEVINPFAPDAEPVVGRRARLETIERFLTRRTEDSLTQEKRVEKLEKRLVPYEHHKKGEDLDKRVENLWSILAKSNTRSVKWDEMHAY